MRSKTKRPGEFRRAARENHLFSHRPRRYPIDIDQQKELDDVASSQKEIGNGPLPAESQTPKQNVQPDQNKADPSGRWLIKAAVSQISEIEIAADRPSKKQERNQIFLHFCY